MKLINTCFQPWFSRNLRLRESSIAVTLSPSVRVHEFRHSQFIYLLKYMSWQLLMWIDIPSVKLTPIVQKTMHYFLLFLHCTILCKKFNKAYTMEGPHRQKVNLNTSTSLIKRRDNKHFSVRKLFFNTESN